MTSSESSSLRRLISRLSPLRLVRRPVEIVTDQAVHRERLRAQIDVMERAFEGAVAVGHTAGRRGGREPEGTFYLYRPDHLLVRATHLETVTDFVARRVGTDPDQIERVAEPVEGLVLIRFRRNADNGADVPDLLDELEKEFPVDGPDGALAAPDHVIYVTYPRFCPATEPELPRSQQPVPRPATDQALGRGVRVSVVDTGLWKASTTNPKLPWLKGVTADPTDFEALDVNHIHPYGGHGTFVAGVVRSVAPATRVEVEGALTKGGAVYESEIIEQLDEALRDNDHPQLISISAGTHSRANIALLSFEMLAAVHGLDDGERTLIVAASGNDGSSDPFWPAAFPWVASVGAVDADGGVAKYSNVGRWVDVYARGTDVVNAFPTGTYVCYEPPNVGEVRTFDSLARWSGTSFATPIVTGLIAARMSSTGESATQAWASVKASGQAGSDPRAGKFVRVGPLT